MKNIGIGGVICAAVVVFGALILIGVVPISKEVVGATFIALGISKFV